jgi:hypothetical protein
MRDTRDILARSMDRHPRLPQGDRGWPFGAVYSRYFPAAGRRDD